MNPSAGLCRVQVTFQRPRAEGAPLGIVRPIARKAAPTRAAEALHAEGREQRQTRARAVTADQRRQERAPCEQLDLASSENPDRGSAPPTGRSASSLVICPRIPILATSRFRPELRATER